MVLACQLATERKSSIDALYVIEVPLNLPIDASLPEERERARLVLERAAHAADMFNVKITPVVVTARSAGKAIVEAAIERRSEVIILGSQGKRRIADKVFGRTIDHVLNNLPCEAIINVIPKTPAVPTGVATATGAAPATPPPERQVRPVTRSRRTARRHSTGRSGERRPTGVKRRAQGLRLGRYLPQQRPGGDVPPEDGRGGEAAKAEDPPPPHNLLEAAPDTLTCGGSPDEYDLSGLWATLEGSMARLPKAAVAATLLALGLSLLVPAVAVAADAAPWVGTYKGVGIGKNAEGKTANIGGHHLGRGPRRFDAASRSASTSSPWSSPGRRRTVAVCKGSLLDGDLRRTSGASAAPGSSWCTRGKATT